MRLSFIEWYVLAIVGGIASVVLVLNVVALAVQ